jgi:hypothetical protein
MGLLKDMICEKISVAVIDDGINEDLYDLGKLEHNIKIKSDLSVVQRESYNTFLLSHGTNCAGIIKKYAGNVGFSSIKVLNDSTMKGEKRQLIKAIDWCVENNIKIVNMSLGSIDFRDFDDIMACVNRAAEAGIIIIAACSNKNVFTYPACLSNVIGVCSSNEYKELQYKFIGCPFDGIDVLASSTHHLTDVFGNSYDTSQCNSYAAPMVTALVCSLLKNKPDGTLAEIKQMLWQESSIPAKDKYNSYLQMDLDWITEKALININSEGEKVSQFPWDEKTRSINIKVNKGESITEDILQELRKSSGDFSEIKNIILTFSEGIDIREVCITYLFNYFNEINKNIVFMYKEGQNPQPVLNLSRGKVKVWDAALYNLAVKEQLKDERPLDIPLLYFHGGNLQELLAAIQEISKRFREEGYNSTALTNICSGKIIGVDYIPDGIAIKRFLTTVYSKYDADIIIVGVLGNVNCVHSIKELADMQIEMEDCTFKIITEDEEETFEKKKSCGDMDIERLFNIIMKHLTGSM